MANLTARRDLASHPKLQNLSRALRLEAGPGQSSAMLTVSFATGKAVIVNTEGGGKASLAISGDIVDESGTMLGDLVSVCERAASAWEQELLQVGVPVPSR